MRRHSANRLLPAIRQRCFNYHSSGQTAIAAGGARADTEFPLLTAPLSLHTNSAFAREEAPPAGSAEGRYFEILGQAQAKAFVSFKEGPKFFKHDSCCC